MRILKGDEHALMPAPLSAQGKKYWCLGVMNYFSFDDPDTLLTETQLWTEAPPLFEPNPVVLDTGGFKPRGEVMLVGACHAPRGETRAASRVTVRVGSLHKSIDVFGNRYWKTAGGVTTGITEPEPFASMPIIWQKAFGGAEYTPNMNGKGLAPVEVGGELRLPLPNLELTGALMGLPSERPRPACFGSVDPSWSPRREKVGTCDEQWKNTVWPGFPLDCNLEFFNWAPEDQMLPGFFSGTEDFTITNMHPDFPRLQGRLPAVRQRVIIRRVDLQNGESIIQELDTQIDTLWLFPEIRRGLVIHRAVTPTEFDDGRDIIELHVVTEQASAPRKSVEELLKSPDEHYAEKADFPKELQIFGLEKLDVFKEDYKQRLLTTRASFERRQIKKTLRGFQPEPFYYRTPGEQHAHMLGQMEKQVVDSEKMRGQMREMIMQSPSQTDMELVTLEESLDFLNRKKEELSSRKGAPTEDLPFEESAVPVTPHSAWHDYFLRFCTAARRNMEQNPELRDKLKSYGFDEMDIEARWFGFLPADRLCSYDAVGLLSPAGGGREFTLPAGLIVPRFSGETLKAVTVLPGWPKTEAHKAPVFLAPGSSREPLLEKAAVPGGPLLWAADDFEAFLAEVVCGEFYEVATAPRPGSALPQDLRESLKRAPSCHVLRAPGCEEEPLFAYLKSLHPKTSCMEFPQGKNLTECMDKGGDAREALLSSLPVKEMGLEDSNTEEDIPSKAIAYLAPHLIRPDDGAPPKTTEELEAIFGRSLAPTPLDNKIKKEVLADLEDKLGDMSQNARPLTRSEVLVLARESKSLEGRHLPALDLSGENFDGVNFSRATFHKTNLAGCSFKGAVFSSCAAHGASLAGADFGGAEFSMASFSGCALENAVFADSKCKQLVFTKSSLDGARFTGASLTLSSFVQCSLKEADFSKATLNLCAAHDSCLDKSVWRESSLDGMAFHDVSAASADFSQCSVLNTGFVDLHAEKVSFKKAVLNGGHFIFNEKGVDLRESDFSGAAMYASSFQQVVLYNADLTGASFNKSVMEKSFAMGCRMPLLQAKESRFIESALDGSDMRYANLFGSAFPSTRLAGADCGNASLYYADLRNAVLGETNFSGANLGKTVIEGQGDKFRRKPEPPELADGPGVE